jgi:hypothetical protein
LGFHFGRTHRGSILHFPGLYHHRNGPEATKPRLARTGDATGPHGL